MILFRLTRLDGNAVAFAEMLRQASGLPVVYAIDERRAPSLLPAEQKISVTDEAVWRLGLFAPENFSWLCGDYVYYLARQQFPEVPFFWLIEADVRISGQADELFAEAARCQSDFLAADIRPAHPDWFWWQHLNGSDIRPYRCFFPVTRLSGRAIDWLLATRRQHSKSFCRCMAWPNDESFVATTLATSGWAMTDLNALLPELWSPETYGFETPIDGDALDLGGSSAKLHHPVLFGKDYERKKTAIANDDGNTFLRRAVRKMVRPVNQRSAWIPDMQSALSK